jgi:hypothetical protein
MLLLKLKLKLKLIYDRKSVGQSVLVSGTHLGPATNFIYFVAHSLTRGRVCNFTLGSKSRRTHGHSLLSHSRLPQPGGSGPRICIPQEQGGPGILPGTVFPIRRLLRLAGTEVEVF